MAPASAPFEIVDELVEEERAETTDRARRLPRRGDEREGRAAAISTAR
jgi:hypothetical protein